jgi:hypothetical protein
VNIKIHEKKAPTGIPRCTIAVVNGQHDNGAWQVDAFVTRYDCYDVSTVCASLRLSPAEALELADRLIQAAHGCKS